MNYSVTGEPAPSQLDQKRKSLLQSMLHGGPGAQRLLSQPGGRGLTRGYTATDSPNAAVPGLTFNPFLAQIQQGVSGLQAPTQQARQVVNDLTGAPGSPPVFAGSGATAGVQAPTPGGAPPPDAGPTDLASAYAQAGINPSSLGGLGWLEYDPQQTPAPAPAPPIPYLRPSSGRNVAY